MDVFLLVRITFIVLLFLSAWSWLCGHLGSKSTLLADCPAYGKTAFSALKWCIVGIVLLGSTVCLIVNIDNPRLFSKESLIGVTAFLASCLLLYGVMRGMGEFIRQVAVNSVLRQEYRRGNVATDPKVARDVRTIVKRAAWFHRIYFRLWRLRLNDVLDSVCPLPTETE